MRAILSHIVDSLTTICNTKVEIIEAVEAALRILNLSEFASSTALQTDLLQYKVNVCSERCIPAHAYEAVPFASFVSDCASILTFDQKPMVSHPCYTLSLFSRAF